MTLARHYLMQAVAGRGDELLAALRALAEVLAGIATCAGSEILRETDGGDRFVFIERWASCEAHAAAAPGIPKEAFAAVMAPLAGKPQAMWLEPVAG